MTQPDRSFAQALRRAAGARRRRLAVETLTRWVGALLPGLGGLLLVALILPPTQVSSAVMAAAALAWILGTFALLVLLPWLRPQGPQAYALWLEQRASLERNELINALQLERDRNLWRDDAVSRALVERSTQRGLRTLEALPLRRLHAEHALRAPLARGLLGVLPFVALWLLAPVRLTDAAHLFLCAGSPAVVPQVALTVSPGDEKIERGGSVTITAEVEGRRRPGEAQIDMRVPGGGWSQAPMTRAEVEGASEALQRDSYRFIAAALKGDLEYRVRSGWASSPIYRIRVLEPLQALGYRKLYEPPAYTGMPVQRQVSSNADVAALTGTRVTLEVRPRRPGVQGRLLFEGRRAHPLRADGPEALAASWLLDRDERFRVELRDEEEGELWVSDTFDVEVVPDLAPSVRLLSPGENITMPADMRVTLAIDCVDDFGMTELALVYGRAEDDPTRLELASWESQQEARVTYNWDLTRLTVLPGQELHYYVQVLDNDPIHGPKVGETELFTIRFPTMAEMYASAQEQRREEAVSLEEALETQEELSHELRQVAQEMLREDQITWEREQEIEDLMDRQEALADRVEQIQQSLDASRERMETQSLFSMEMIDKVRQIQELVSQISSQEFHEQLKRMRQALETMDRSELQKAMEQMKISQEEITQALDRTLNMLRQLMAEEKLDRMLQKMQELVTRQEMINEQLAAQAPPPDEGETPPPADQEPRPGEQAQDADTQTPPGDEEPPRAETQQDGEGDQGQTDAERPMSEEEAADLAAQQESVRKQLEELREQIEALRKESEEQLKEFAEALQEQMKSGEAQQAQQEMQSAQEAMEQQNRSASLKFGRKAKQSLQAMSAKMSSLKQEIDIEKQMRLARSLYNIANRMVDASVEQEALVGVSDRMGPRDLAVQQQELYDEVGVVRDSLEAVAKETPVVTRSHMRAVAKAMREIGQARDHLETGRRHSAVSLAGESSRSLNTAVKSLLEAANQAQSNCASSCSSPFNKMQSLTGQQMELNQQTQQMLGQCNTPRPTMSQSEAMMRMAARQEMIRKGMSDVRDEIQTSGKTMNELNEAIEEMEELVEQFRSRQADPRIIERQEKILSRLLSAQRSIRKREETEERTSRPGEDPELRVGPGPVDMGRPGAETLQRSMLRGSQDPVPSEYRGMVERYMRLLLRTRP